MADYHPLDTRYKGPSTAYRGSAKKRADPPEPPQITPPPPPRPASDGPWGKAAPALPMPDRTPPPVPRSVGQSQIKRSYAGRRVLIGAAILIAVVLLNAQLTRSVGLTIQDIEDSLREMETIDGGFDDTDNGVKL